MNGTDDLRVALADEITRRQLAEARLAASCPGVNEVGVIAHAALLETLTPYDESPQNGAAATAVR